MPLPGVGQAYVAAAGTVRGAEEATDAVEIPAQGENTFSSFLCYVVVGDIPVVVKDVRVTASADPSVAVFDGAFGGVVVDGDTYTFPAGAEGWAGVANNNTGLYPISLENGGTLTFTGSADADVNVRFRFEFNPHPDVNPAYDTATVTVAAGSADYSIDLASQGANTFSSFIMYVVDRDLPVTVSNVKVTAADAPVDPVDPDVPGCTDSAADNYNAAATSDDGS